MKIKYLAFALLFFTLNKTTAQSYAWGVKGGLTIANQRFQGGGTFDNGLLFKYHGALFVESAPDDPTSVLYAQFGYHTRGHARRFRGAYYNPSNNQFEKSANSKQEFVFNNLAAIVGVKRRGVLNSENAYYAVGLRAEYTIGTSLREPDGSLPLIYSLYYPTSNYVQKFNYGLTLSGGYEFPFSDLIGGFVEFNVHPDISRQYFQPALNIVLRDPFTGENINGVQEQSIRNLTFELTIGFRFLRKIVYVN